MLVTAERASGAGGNVERRRVRVAGRGRARRSPTILCIARKYGLKIF